MRHTITTTLSAIQAAGIELPEAEVRFASPRRFRFDFAWPARMVAWEIEGGVWRRGRHVRPAGYARDCEKYSLAATLGWRVIRTTTGQVADGTALKMLEEVLRVGGEAEKV